MTDNKALISKATDWLSAGGLFNAELMDPDETAQLVADLRDALKGPVIDDDMVKAAVDARRCAIKKHHKEHQDSLPHYLRGGTTFFVVGDEEAGMRAALTAALHIPIAELNQLVSGVDLEEPTNAE